MQANIRVGKANYGGQSAEEGITYATTGTVEVGDTVSPSTAVDATVVRCPDGAEPVGVLVTKDRDGLGAVYNFETVTISKLSGAYTRGVAKIVGDGLGGVKIVAAGAAVGVKVNVIGQAIDGADTLVAYVRQ